MPFLKDELMDIPPPPPKGHFHHFELKRAFFLGNITVSCRVTIAEIMLKGRHLGTNLNLENPYVVFELRYTEGRVQSRS